MITCGLVRALNMVMVFATWESAARKARLQSSETIHKHSKSMSNQSWRRLERYPNRFPIVYIFRKKPIKHIIKQKHKPQVEP